MTVGTVDYLNSISLTKRLFFLAFVLFSLGVSSVLAQGAVGEGVIRAGGPPTGAPITFRDGDGAQQGIVIDILNAVAEDLGIEIEYVPIASFAEMVPALVAGEIDIIASGFVAMPNLPEQVVFSDPYFEGALTEALVVLNSDITPYESWTELEGETVGALAGTLYPGPLQDSGIFTEVRLYEQNTDLLAAVASGEIKAAVINAAIATYLLNQGQYPELQVVRSYQPQVTGSFVIPVRSRPELLESINASLAKLREDGTIDRIFAEWGLE